MHRVAPYAHGACLQLNIYSSYTFWFLSTMMLVLWCSGYRCLRALVGRLPTCVVSLSSFLMRPCVESFKALCIQCKFSCGLWTSFPLDCQTRPRPTGCLIWALSRRSECFSKAQDQTSRPWFQGEFFGLTTSDHVNRCTAMPCFGAWIHQPRERLGWIVSPSLDRLQCSARHYQLMLKR